VIYYFTEAKTLKEFNSLSNCKILHESNKTLVMQIRLLKTVLHTGHQL